MYCGSKLPETNYLDYCRQDSRVVLKEDSLNVYPFLYLCVMGGESLLVATESPYIEKYTTCWCQKLSQGGSEGV